MARYFLHLRDGHDEILDPDGAEYATHAALQKAVLNAARELIAADALTGQVRLDQRIDAEDADGTVVHTLPFAEAVRFSDA